MLLQSYLVGTKSSESLIFSFAIIFHGITLSQLICPPSCYWTLSLFLCFTLSHPPDISIPAHSSCACAEGSSMDTWDWQATGMGTPILRRAGQAALPDSSCPLWLPPALRKSSHSCTVNAILVFHFNIIFIHNILNNRTNKQKNGS